MAGVRVRSELDPLTWAAAAAPLIVFLAVYLPAVGHGFIRDDFTWALDYHVRHLDQLPRLLRSDTGFFRPIVGLTFAIDERLFGARAYGYGVTNVLLALGCAAAMARLARAFGLGRGAATLAAAVWLLNFKCMGMAVLWISGRTSLVLTLAAVLAATAVVERRTRAAAAWLLVALFAKEEAVPVAFVLIAWGAILHGGDGRREWRRWTIACGGALACYLVARGFTHAMTPFDAPAYYRFTFDPWVVLTNVKEYLDRAATVPAAAAIVALAALGRAPRFAADDRRILLCALVWLAGALALTIWLPVRSDLYACCPSIGAALAAAVVASRAWSGASSRAMRRALAVAIVAPLALSPVYYLRTARWVRLADLSTATLGELYATTSSLPDDVRVDIRDDPGARANLAASFDTTLESAYFFVSRRHRSVAIDPPAAGDASRVSSSPCDACPHLTLALVDGHLRR